LGAAGHAESPHLGYGSSGTGGIPGNSILVFNITLNSIN